MEIRIYCKKATSLTDTKRRLPIKASLFILMILFLASVAAADVNIAPISDNTATASVALIQIIQGNISSNGQKITHPFTAPRDGRYRFEMAELRGNARIYIEVFNRLEEKISSNTCGNGGRLTLDGVAKGENYLIRINQYDGFSGYRLIISRQY